MPLYVYVIAMCAVASAAMAPRTKVDYDDKSAGSPSTCEENVHSITEV